MSLYEITNLGSDDETCDTFDLTEDEYKFLNMIFTKLNNKSYDAYMPTIYIEKKEERR